MNSKDHPIASDLSEPRPEAGDGKDASASSAVVVPIHCDMPNYKGKPSSAQAAGKHLESATVTPFASCKQTLWFSFFFDGTGNNLDADYPTQEHSNVARLYLAHQGDENMGGRWKPGAKMPFGTYRVYIPGVGTYFRAIGDEGGTTLGLGFGKLGDERIKWALEQFDDMLAHHVSLAADPKNAILEVNIAAFGFSRGAALARAFIKDFVDKRCRYQNDKLKSKVGNCDVRVRFVGIFDTVASSGVAMSGNNMTKYDAATGDVASHLRGRMRSFLHVRPSSLAFSVNGQPGADPAPGKYDGHMAYGSRMHMPAVVEEVRHIVAAHETRNSFPLDSLSIRTKSGFEKPEHFYEYPFPGVHSDVGGGYRPGESGKSQENSLKLSQVALRLMLNFAVAARVPLHPESAWQDDLKSDFEIRDKLEDSYKYYQQKLLAEKGNLGSYFNAHMKLYYQWRFQEINKKSKDDKPFKERVEKNSAVFKAEGEALDKQIAEYKKIVATHKRALNRAEADRMDVYQGRSANLSETQANANVAEAQAAWERVDIAYHELKAKKLALPNDTELITTTTLYDAQLITDAQAIRNAVNNPSMSFDETCMTDRASLRPHYKGLLEAYEDEFHNNKGLRDPKLIEFFEEYVHDSLSGFAKDSTLPSDPRVIYVGGDNKHRFANRPVIKDEASNAAQVA